MATLHIVDMDDHPSNYDIVDLDAFLDANEEDMDTCAEVRGLPVGATTTFGGGAAPVVRVTRVS